MGFGAHSKKSKKRQKNGLVGGFENEWVGLVDGFDN